MHLRNVPPVSRRSSSVLWNEAYVVPLLCDRTVPFQSCRQREEWLSDCAERKGGGTDSTMYSISFCAPRPMQKFSGYQKSYVSSLFHPSNLKYRNRTYFLQSGDECRRYLVSSYSCSSVNEHSQYPYVPAPSNAPTPIASTHDTRATQSSLHPTRPA